MYARVVRYWNKVNDEYLPYFAKLYTDGNYWKGTNNKDGDFNPLNMIRLKIENGQYYNCRRLNDYTEIIKRTGQELGIELNNLDDCKTHIDKLFDVYFEKLREGDYENQLTIDLKNVVGALQRTDYSNKFLDFSKISSPGEVNLEQLKDIQFRERVKRVMEETDEYNNYFLILPETYDLILKSDRPYNIEFLKYAIFISYLEELYYREATTANDRYVFSLDTVQKILSKLQGIPKSYFFHYLYPMPFIPNNSCFLVPSTTLCSAITRDGDEEYNFLSSLLEGINNTDDWKIPTWIAPSGNKISFHLNGSKLTSLITNQDYGVIDIDIRIDYAEKRDQVTNVDFDHAVKHLSQLKGLQRIEKITFSKNKYKYIAFDESNVKYDIFTAKFGFVSNYHVPPVRCDLAWDGLRFYPSGLVAHMTGTCLDLRLFVNETINPFEIVTKYLLRHFSFCLNPIEMALWLEYIVENKNLRLRSMEVPFTCYPPFAPPGFKEWYTEVMYEVPLNEEPRESFQLKEICPPGFRESLKKFLMGSMHNKILSTRKRFVSTDKNLPVPDRESLLLR